MKWKCGSGKQEKGGRYMSAEIYYDKTEKRWKAKCTMNNLNAVMSALKKTER